LVVQRHYKEDSDAQDHAPVRKKTERTSSGANRPEKSAAPCLMKGGLRGKGKVLEEGGKKDMLGNGHQGEEKGQRGTEEWHSHPAYQIRLFEKVILVAPEAGSQNWGKKEGRAELRLRICRRPSEGDFIVLKGAHLNRGCTGKIRRAKRNPLTIKRGGPRFMRNTTGMGKDSIPKNEWAVLALRKTTTDTGDADLWHVRVRKRGLVREWGEV